MTWWMDVRSLGGQPWNHGLIQRIGIRQCIRKRDVHGHEANSNGDCALCIAVSKQAIR